MQLYIHYSQYGINLLHFVGNLIYDQNWYDFIHNHLIRFEFDLIFSEFESACWGFGLTLCEPGLTTREFELLS